MTSFNSWNSSASYTARKKIIGPPNVVLQGPGYLHGMIIVTMKCTVSSCFASTTWEDAEPTVTPDGGWAAARRPPPPGWHLVKPVPGQVASLPVPYSGALLEHARGACPAHAEGEIRAGRAVP